jgi:hypothetical protein
MMDSAQQHNRENVLRDLVAVAADDGAHPMWVIQAVGRDAWDLAFLEWLGRAVPRIRTDNVPSRHDFLCRAFEVHAERSHIQLGCPLPPAATLALCELDGTLPSLPPVGDGVRTDKQRATYPFGRTRWVLNAHSLYPWHKEYLVWLHSIPKNGRPGVASRHDMLWDAFRALADHLAGRFNCPRPAPNGSISPIINAEVML